MLSICARVHVILDLKWNLGASGGFTVAGNDIVVALSNKTTFKMAYYRKRGTKWSKMPFDLKDKNDHVGILAISNDGTSIVAWTNHSDSGEGQIYGVAKLDPVSVGHNPVNFLFEQLL